MPLLTELENVRSPLAIDMALLTELCAGGPSTSGLEGPVKRQVGKLALQAPNSYSRPRLAAAPNQQNTLPRLSGCPLGPRLLPAGVNIRTPKTPQVSEYFLDGAK